MRNLKFRAWDAANKQMRVLGCHISFVGTIWVWKDSSCKDSEVLNMPVMQSAFLKDKTGKKLFFKDLVKIQSCGAGFEDEPFQVVQDDFGIPCFVHPTRFGVMITFEQYFLGSLTRCNNDFEIVGDIYNNPELLKP